MSKAQIGNKNTLGKHWKLSEVSRKNISEAIKGIKYPNRKKMSTEAKKSFCKAQKNRWGKVPKEERIVILDKWIKSSCGVKSSSIEKAICKVLDLLNIEYETQYRVGNWFIDIYISSKNLIIECNGEYWHNLPRVKNRDKRLEDYAKNNGYKILWLWEKEIN